MNKIKKGLIWFFNSFIWLGVILLFLDILSKNLVVINQSVTKDGVELIPGFLRIQYIVNPNIAFGMSLGSDVATKVVFSIVAVIIAAILIYVMIKKWDKLNRFYRASFIMIIVGAIGNVIDRIFYSQEYLNFYSSAKGIYITGVVDWIDFYGIWGFHFNIADSCIVLAAIMLIVYMIVEEIVAKYKASKAAKPIKTPEEKAKENEKVLSKTEQEKLALLEKDKEENE